MRLHRLDITAFGPFAETTTIDFDRLGADGLFLLHGHTGAGKTTVLDAIGFALYGKVPGARGEKALHSDHADPQEPPRVGLEATLGGRRLRLIRTAEYHRPSRRGGGTVKVNASGTLTWLDGRGENLSRLTDIGDEVLRLLGMSADQFFQVVLLPQGDFARFLRADNEDREKLLEKLFDTQRFGAAELWLADRRRAAAAELESHKLGVDRLITKVGMAAGFGGAESIAPGDATAWSQDLLAAARTALTEAESAAADCTLTADRARAAAAEARRRHDLHTRRAAARAALDRYRADAPRRADLAAELAAARRADPVAAALDEARALVRALRRAEAATASAASALATQLTADAAADIAGVGSLTVRDSGRSTTGTQASRRPDAPRAPEDRRPDDGDGVRTPRRPDDAEGGAADGPRGPRTGGEPATAGSGSGGTVRAAWPAGPVPESRRAGGGDGGRESGGPDNPMCAPAEGHHGAVADEEPVASDGTVGADRPADGARKTRRPGGGEGTHESSAPCDRAGTRPEGHPGTTVARTGRDSGSGIDRPADGAGAPPGTNPGDIVEGDLDAAVSQWNAQLGVLGDIADEAGIAERLRRELRTLHADQEGLARQADELERQRAAAPAAVAEAGARVREAESAAAQVPGLRGELERHREAAGAAAELARKRTALEQARAELATARDRHLDARERVVTLRERRIAGMAAELADGLVDGQPCKVCGSAQHPHPAEPSDEAVSRDEESAATAAERAAEALRDTVTQQVNGIEREIEALIARGGDGDPVALAAAVRAAADRLADAADLADQVPALTARLETVRSAESRLQDESRDLDARRATVATTLSTGTARLAELDTRLRAAAGADGTIEARTRRLRALVTAATGLRAARTAEAAARTAVTHVADRIENLARAAGFLAAEPAEPSAVPSAAAGATAPVPGRAEPSATAGTCAPAPGQADPSAVADASAVALGHTELSAAADTTAPAPGHAELSSAAAATVPSDAESSAAAGTTTPGHAEPPVGGRSGHPSDGAAVGAGDRPHADEEPLTLFDFLDDPGPITPEPPARPPRDDIALLTRVKDAVAPVIRPLARQQAIEGELAEAERIRDHADTVLAEPGIRDLAEETPGDPAGFEQRFTEAQQALTEAVARRSAAATRVTQLEELGAQLWSELERIAPLQADFDELAGLAEVVAGRGENNRRMSLRSYVLAARLEEVAEAGSLRLRRMSGGRYEFVHTDKAGPRGRRGGLGLDVRDDYTGAVRSADTLSGGETFMASLSLALGLADVVAAEAGGLELDTLFIDEGFGSLDADTLDAVMGVLDELRAGGRVVGIVSHVDEMRQRIPSRLHVVRGRAGSRLEATVA
ncbi:AAA family ATPase [Nocardia thailandica]